MTIRLVALVGLLAALTAGCSSTPPLRPASGEVTITVTTPGGQPVKDATLLCLPTHPDQAQGGGKLDASGKVKAKLVPGKYTIVLEGSPAALKAVPVKYHQAEAGNTFEAPADGGSVEIKLTN